eukprot:scaffold197_cov268-Chaetoceros_neogracile.AAC.29
MDLAKSARRVSPATAEMAQAAAEVQDRDEYKVEAAENTDETSNYVTKFDDVDDARKSTPGQQLDKPEAGISVQKLMDGGSSVIFQGKAGVCRGMQMHLARRFTLALSKLAPSVWDQREEADPNYIYTVPLSSLKAVKENPKKPHKRSMTVSPGFGQGVDRQGDNLVNILLLDARDKLAYQITLDTIHDEGVADRFVLAVENINSAEKKQQKLQKE